MTYEKPSRGKTTETASVIYQAAVVLVFIILGFCLYSNTLKAPFVFDDMDNIKENPHLFLTKLDLKNIIAAGFSGPNAYRPIANISFALNYYFHRHNIAGYHITNTIIHILTAIFLYLFVKNTLKAPSLRYRYPRYSSIAFFATVVWLVHPIQTQSVTYIVQRMNSLAAMFYILSLFLYVKGRLTSEDSKRSWPWFTGSIVAGILAVGCKETAATLPIFILVYEWYFFQDLNRAWLKRHTSDVIGVFILFSAMGLWYLGSNPLEKILSGYNIKDFSLIERLLTYPRVMVFYISLVAYPHPARLNVDPDFVASHSLLSPLTTLPCTVVVVGLIVLGIYMAKRERLLSFCILWFFGNLVIESTAIALQLVFEQRLYLPSMFVSVAIAWLVWRWIRPRWVRVAAFSIVTIIFCMWTYERNSVWRDPFSLWKDCVSKSPNKSRPYHELGLALLSEGKIDEAEVEFHKALAIKPDLYKAYNNLGLVLCEAGKVDEAIVSFKEALAIKPDYYKAHKNLGLVLASMGKMDEAIGHFQKALQIEPNNAGTHYNLAITFEKLGKVDEAIAHYRQTLELNPNHEPAKERLQKALASKAKSVNE